MQITIVSVENGAVPAGKKYKMLEVAFKDAAGKVSGKKIMDFTYPLVYNTLKAASQGEKYDVTTVKEGDYWQWSEIKKAEGGSAQVTQGDSSSKTQQFTQQTKSNYETKEERAARQVMIVRQSSLSNAVTTLTPGSKAALDPTTVIAVAKQYEAYVLSNDPVQELINMQDDLPD